MRLKILASGVVALVIGYTFFWHYMAGEVEDRIEDWVKSQKSTGLSVKYGDLEISGFPYRMELALKSLKIAKTGRDQIPVLVTTEQATLVAFPWKINHGIIISDGGKVRIGGRGKSALSVSIGKTRSSLIGDVFSQTLHRASFVMENVSWISGKRTKNRPPSAAREVKLHILRPTASISSNDMELPIQLKVYVDAKDVIAHEIPVGILGKKADQLLMDIQLHGDKLPSYSKNSLEAWRDQGGTLAVKNFEIKSGEMDLDLNGEATLDQDLKPLGAFSSRIRGVDHIVGVLAGHSGFQVDPGRMILDELTRMSKVEQSGKHKGKSAIDLSISLQGGLLFLGPIPVYELPPVVE